MKFIKIFLILNIVINLHANDINFDELSNSINQKKQILVFFHMDHCPWCKKLIKISLSDKEVMNTINKYFIYIDIDIQTSGNIMYEGELISKVEFARKFGIYFYPTVLMFKDGKLIENIKGYRNKQKFTNIVKYIGSKSQDKFTLKEFIVDLEFRDN